MRQWTDVLLDERERGARSASRSSGIGSRSFWFPIHRQAPYLAGRRAASPMRRSISERGLWLPSNFSLTEGDVTRVADVVKSALKRG